MSSSNRTVSVILTILAIIGLAPGACGAYFLGAVSLESIGQTTTPSADAAGYAILIGSVAAASVYLSLFIVAIVFRASSWDWRGRGSLIVAGVSGLFSLICLAALLSLSGAAPDAMPVGMAMLAIAAGLTIVPPFLHWRNNP